ncbi:armadillo-type protein [Mycena crocata]|nr:armadillo-type protein [Mycena crocata]
MPPLTRQQTLESVRSWWSDSNPPGATISLHTATKPLMWVMYHRAVLDFIDKNRGVPLSSMSMEIYSSYLAFKYIALPTKAVILRELHTRTSSDEDSALVVADALLAGADLVEEILYSPDANIRSFACEILGNLAQYDSTAQIVLHLEPCDRLQRLLGESDVEVLASATYALSVISQTPAGAQAVLAANVVPLVVQLVGSPDARVRRWASTTLGQLARHKSTAGTVIRGDAVARLASILSDENINLSVLDAAIKAFSQICRWADAAALIITSGVLSSITDLLDSPARISTCHMLAALANHTAAAEVISTNCTSSLVELLSYKDENVRLVAARVLRHPEVTSTDSQKGLLKFDGHPCQCAGCDDDGNDLDPF